MVTRLKLCPGRASGDYNLAAGCKSAGRFGIRNSCKDVNSGKFSTDAPLIITGDLIFLGGGKPNPAVLQKKTCRSTGKKPRLGKLWIPVSGGWLASSILMNGAGMRAGEQGSGENNG